MRIVKIIVAGIIGFILALGLWKFGDSGYAERWEKLPSPPQQISELITTGGLPLFIKTSDGKIYRYSDWRNEGWIQESEPAKLINPYEITTPCDFSAPEFSIFSNAPEDIQDCLQQKTMYADGYIKSTFIVDSTGNIWSWQHTRTPDAITLMFCLPPSGLLVGLVIGVGLVRKNNVEET